MLAFVLDKYEFVVDYQLAAATLLLLIFSFVACSAANLF
jgi:hypothetical protein